MKEQLCAEGKGRGAGEACGRQGQGSMLHCSQTLLPPPLPLHASTHTQIHTHTHAPAVSRQLALEAALYHIKRCIEAGGQHAYDYATAQRPAQA